MGYRLERGMELALEPEAAVITATRPLRVNIVVTSLSSFECARPLEFFADEL